jgi:hypothetical protein
MVFTEFVFMAAIEKTNCLGRDHFGKIRNCPRAVAGLEQETSLLGCLSTHTVFEFLTVGCAYGGFEKFHTTI